MVGRVAPFAATAAAGILVLAATNKTEPWALLLAALMTAVLALMAVFVPWHRLPVATQAVVPLAFFVMVLVLRTAGGGNRSGIGALSLLPVCWAAMYAGRVALGLALIGTGVVFYAPPLLLGGAEYPLSDAGRGTTPVLIAALVGISFQRAARAQDQQREAAAASAAQLAAVANVMHGLHAGDDARAVLCRGACEVSGATTGQLVELRGNKLVITGSVGIDAPTQLFPTGEGSSALERCFSTARRVLVTDPTTDPSVSWSMGALDGLSSVLYEPVMQGGRVVAVLIAAWQEPPRSIENAVAGVGLMAVEAGIAMERADLLAWLDRTARTDELTGVANRRAWEELLPAELSRGPLTGPLCVALLDLDHFKAYNDERGHPAGDRVLRDAASSWARQLRGTDTLARYGGEEFAVVLPQCDMANAVAVLEKVRMATPHAQTVSIGIAQWDGQETAAALLLRADTALYAAKTDGRNRISTAS